MFTGLACFSPSVGREPREVWKSHGGTIASSIDQLDGVQWFFATWADFEWIGSLIERGVTVYQQSYITDSLKCNSVLAPTQYIFHVRNGCVFIPAPKVATAHLDQVDAPTSPGGLQQSPEDTSEDEVELTLVEKVHDSIQNDNDGSSPDTKADQLLAFLSTKRVDGQAPVITLDDILQLTAPVLHCVHFEVGGTMDDRPFNAKRLNVMSISRP